MKTHAGTTLGLRRPIALLATLAGTAFPTATEARALAELADQYQAVTQQGNKPGDNARTVEILRAGTSGEFDPVACKLSNVDEAHQAVALE